MSDDVIRAADYKGFAVEKRDGVFEEILKAIADAYSGGIDINHLRLSITKPVFDEIMLSQPIVASDVRTFAEFRFLSETGLSRFTFSGVKLFPALYGSGWTMEVRMHGQDD